ncbi:26553_t:CDS:1 [Dentiscutata erythropus]|uniref:26553_t:CDS:1 n=1 Tax=Dentiscutata erythropus TaxID=1348616 RepID=A0A9N9FSC3_9GLOM|nr:26553_t:CDS:1 [Dentiscutata erythropus]
MSNSQMNMKYQIYRFHSSSGLSKFHGHNANVLPTLPQITLPFPPVIRAIDIAKKRIRSKICKKSPNAFFVYRKAFVDHLSKLQHKLKMTEVSRLVSSHWKNEKPEIKLAYENIAKDVEKELNDIRIRDLVYADIHEKCKRRRNKNLEKRARRSAASFGSFDACKNFVSTIDFSKEPPVEPINLHQSQYSTFPDKTPSDSFSSLENSNISNNITQFYDYASSDDLDCITLDSNNPIFENNTHNSVNIQSPIESNFVLDPSINTNISATSQIDQFVFSVPDCHPDIASPYDDDSASTTSPTISEHSDFFPTQLADDFQSNDIYNENPQIIICYDNNMYWEFPDSLITNRTFD